MEGGSLREGVPGLEVFLSIEGGGFDMCHSGVIGRAEEDEVGREQLFVLDPADVPHQHLAPLDHRYLPISYHCRGLLMVVFEVGDRALVVLVAWVKRRVP